MFKVFMRRGVLSPFSTGCWKGWATVKIFVTGGTGFVGRNIVERLVKEGHEVTITSSGIGPHYPGVKKILYRGFEGIDWKYLRGQDAVVHQFANNDTRCQDESEMFRANVDGPIKMFTAAVEGGCKKFVYASSTAVYGAQPAPYVENTTLVKPLNVYGQSKAKFDEFAMKFAQDHQVLVTGFRYCNVYGPGETHKEKRMSMIGQLLRQMLAGKRPAIFKDGEQKRDWIYVQDVVQANMLALARKAEEPFGRIYNLGSGVATTFNEIIRTINDVLREKLGRSPLATEYIDCSFASEYQSFTQCGMDKAKKELGLTIQYDLRAGIAAYLRDLTGAA